MSILTKVLLVFVVLAIPPVLYLGAGVLNVNEVWRKKVATLEKQRETEKQAVDLLENGDYVAQTSTYTPPLKPKGTLGVAQLTAARDTLKVGRSRMWYGTLPAATIDPNAGTLVIKVDASAPVNATKREALPKHGITDQTRLYVFSNPPVADPKEPWKSAIGKNIHKYLGEFVVSGFAVPAGTTPADSNLPVKPVATMTPAEWLALRGPGTDVDVVFYDAMPSDDHDAFLGLTDDEIRGILPDSTAEQFVADGRNIEKYPALKNDPALKEFFEVGIDPDTKATATLFRRPLNRYDILFHDVAERIVNINNKLAFEKKELEYQLRAETRGKDEVTKVDADIKLVKDELVVLEAEKMLAQKHLATLQAKVAELTRQLQTQLATNKQLTDELAGRKTTVLPPQGATAAAQ